MKRAYQEYRVSNRMAVETASSPIHLAPYPPDPWYIRGPRGGLYVATGERERLTTQDEPEAWMRNETLVVDRSEGIRYLRPGTTQYLEAQEALR